MKPPMNWHLAYSDCIPPPDLSHADELVLVSRHSCALGAAALRERIAIEAYNPDLLAELELRLASQEESK